MLHGKDVVEISVLKASKGDALVALRDELGASVVLYAGDDVTDEHAFEVLRPATSRSRWATVTPWRASASSTPEELVAALGTLADAL